MQKACQVNPRLVASNRLPERTRDSPEERELNLKFASDSIVLLKNEGRVLPLQTASMRSIAVIGPNAKLRTVSGGGSAYLTPSYIVTPLEGIQSAMAGKGIAIKYAPGCYGK